MSEKCIFCQIATGEAPCHKIWENETHLAFLSIFPNTEGFSVVIPKEHHQSYAFEASEQVYNQLLLAARQVGLLIDKAYPDVARTGLILEGFGVNHLHAKLFPMHGTKNINKEGWTPFESELDKYFEVYEGYISSHGGPRADDQQLAAIARNIKGE